MAREMLVDERVVGVEEPRDRLVLLDRAADEQLGLAPERLHQAQVVIGIAQRIDDDVVLEVDDLFEARRLHVEQVAEPARHRLEEPNVHNRRGQFDVAHSLAADARVRDLHAAAVADHALVLHPAVLAAGALPVLLGAEDLLAEESILLWL